MKKVLLPLLIASLVLVLAGCPGWFDWFKSTVMSIPEIIQWIEDNDATSTGNFLVETEGIITYAYSYYAYVVDENNNGIKIETDSSKFDMDDDFSPQDRIRIVGSPYRKDYSDAFEYRIDTDVASGMVELIESNVDLPDPVILSAGATLTSDLFAKLVQFTGVYKGLDGYSHYTFDNGGEIITVYKYSDMPALTVDATYTIMGVVGQTYGYKLFVWDQNYVTAE